MMKQQEEIQQVYDKYGTSMMGGCLPLLIQMPFLFALYPVIYSIETYVPAIKSAPESVQRFLTIPNLKEAPIQMIRNSGDYAIPAAAIIITAILLPVLSGATQMLNIKLSQSATGQQLDKDNPMAGTMKTMNTTMPLLSVFMVPFLQVSGFTGL
jgi:YidC/Oxa1 family membrane protein insertase